MSVFRYACAAGLFACLLLFGAPASAERVLYAISIGNNAPPAADASLPALQYADDDAIRWHELFERAGAHAALLTVMDQATQRRHGTLRGAVLAPTLLELRKALDAIAPKLAEDRQQGREPVLYLTFSGHGAISQQGEYHLSFVDGGLTQDMLFAEVLTPLRGYELHLIIDACHAAGVVGMRGAFDRELDATRVALDPEDRQRLLEAQSLAQFPSVGALIASASNQEAHEWSRIEAGVFTHQVISALIGAADVNTDQRIEYGEVQAFVAASSRLLADPRAVPNVIAHAPSANPHAPLMDLRALHHSVQLTGTATQLGRLSIDLADGRRLADAHLSGAHTVTLSLPEQPGTYLRRELLEAELPVAAPEVLVASLDFKPQSAQARGPLDRSLRTQLFASPYSRDYYLGFVDSQQIPAVDLSIATPLAQVSETHAPNLRPSPPTRADQAATPKWLGPALLITSGVALVTSAVATAIALDAKSSFDDTDFQRPAHELSDRYRLAATVAVISAGAALGSGIGAWLTWPSSGQAELGLVARDQF